MTRWLWANADVTLAALRPKCPSCNGTRVMDCQYTEASTGTPLKAVYHVPGPCHCVNTDHPGWAA